MPLFYNTRKRFYSCILWLVYEYGDKYSFEFCSRFPAGRVEPLRQAQIYKKRTLRNCLYFWSNENTKHV